MRRQYVKSSKRLYRCFESKRTYPLGFFFLLHAQRKMIINHRLNELLLTFGIGALPELYRHSIHRNSSDMKKIFGFCSLVVINFSALYLIYWYILIIGSTKVDNVFYISYEPSGMQLYFYFVSFPFFLVLSLLSILHSYYFNLKNSLSLGMVIIWISYLALLLFMDMVLHHSSGKNLLYYGSLIISFCAICYIIYTTYYQISQLTESSSLEKYVNKQ